MSGTNGNVGAPVACCKTLPKNDGERQTCAGTGGAVPSTANSNRDKV